MSRSCARAYRCTATRRPLLCTKTSRRAAEVLLLLLGGRLLVVVMVVLVTGYPFPLPPHLSRFCLRFDARGSHFGVPRASDSTLLGPIFGLQEPPQSIVLDEHRIL